MERLLQSDITKILLFFILTMLAAAIVSPWLYNVGMFLAEVGEERQFNKLVDWLATQSGGTSFPLYFNTSLVLCSLLLAGPYITWLDLRNRTCQPLPSPWRMRLPGHSIARDGGQALHRNSRAALHLATGFLLTGGLLTLSVWILLTMGWFSLDGPDQWWRATRAALASAVLLAVIKEWLFRGMILGVFMRSMCPAAAIITSSLIYALIHFLLPPDTIHVADPDKADAGFRLLKLMSEQFVNPRQMAFSFVTLVTIGLILGYARYRTASLWLPIGLHAGWIFAHRSLQSFTGFNPDHPPLSTLLIGPDKVSGVLPLCLLLTTGFLVHVFAQISEQKKQPQS